MMRTSTVESTARLLVVEDLAMMRKFLIEACWAVIPVLEVWDAATIEEGMKLALKHRPEVVILDLVLPDGDGLDLVPILREKVPGIKFVAVSTRLDDYTMHRIGQLNLKGFVDKNESTFEIVPEAVTAVLAGRSYYSAAVTKRIEEMKANPLSFSKLLSDREQEMLALIGRGLEDRRIASRLNLSANTVRNHRQNIMTKLELQSTPQLMAYALEKGFTRSLSD